MTAGSIANRFPTTVEPRIQTTAAVHGHKAQTASCSRLLAAVGNRDRSSVYTPVVPVPKLSKATLARLGSNNARNNLQHTGDVLMHFFSFYLLL
ncbi:hypothetical protein Tco_0426085 [Tanacetum coccineum]